eukprot:COSAG02_NODE_2220_length_9474_cov_3.985280_3_plen_200_part_00
MKSTIEGFSASFRWFLFGVEFVAVLCALLSAIAVYDEADAYTRAPAGTQLLAMLRLCTMCAYLGMYSIIIFGLAHTASGITGVAQRVTDRVHALCGRIAQHDPGSLAEARFFYEHVASDCEKIGFSAMGIVISPALVAKLGYSTQATTNMSCNHSRCHATISSTSNVDASKSGWSAGNVRRRMSSTALYSSAAAALLPA